MMMMMMRQQSVNAYQLTGTGGAGSSSQLLGHYVIR